MSAAAAPSQKLLRLDAEIDAEPDPVKRGCLKAERAGFRGRQGDFDLARKELDALQQDFSRSPHASVSIWMHIAEGWMAHYSDHPAAAKDHMQRAYALSTAAGLSDLRALSAAWLAHLAFSRNDFVSMAKSLRIALQTVSKDFHPAQARLSMVMAMSYHFSRRLDLATPWYKRCREHAFAEGDEGTISALSFNMSGLQANHAIQTSVFGGNVGDYIGLALTGANSTQSFDLLARTASRTSWVYIVQAYALSAATKYAEANHLYEVNLDQACDQGLLHQRAFFLADRAWCRWHLADLAGARCDIGDAIALISDEMYVEDRAVARGRLGQVLQKLGDFDEADFHRKLALQDWAVHEEMRSKLLELLTQIKA